VKPCIEGALDQLSTEVNAVGEVDHYLWGFEDDYDSWVWISAETHERIRRFLLEGSGNDLHDIEGVMAGEPSDIPFGARVKVWLHIENRHSDESAWFFAIEPASGVQRVAV
jgi:hypothetical protein